MSQYEAGMTQVNFQDEDDATEEVNGNGVHVDFAPKYYSDTEALVSQMDDALNVPCVPPRRKGISMTKLCICGIPLLAIVGVVAYLLVGSNNDNVSSTLPAPPANLAARCAQRTDECRMACEPADCCDYPSNLALSCLKGNEANCLTYHQYCSILSNGNEATKSDEKLPPVPSNLAQLCATNELATVDGFMECQEACQSAECCYRDASSGPCNNPECSEYAPCLVLSASDNVKPAIEPFVAEECSDLDTLDGRSACRVACSQALCCFGEAGCPQPDYSFCSQYTICNNLEKNLNVEASSNEISESCDSGHLSLCEVVCERGACCFASEGCPVTAIDCTSYGACGVIYGDSPDDDAVMHGGGNGESSGSAGSDTGNTASGGGGTPSEGNSDGGGGNTTSIDGQDVSDPTGGSIVFKIDVDDACITFDPAAAGAADQDCPKLCANAGCCFTTEGCSDNTNCHIYEECDIIYAVDDNDDDTGDNQTQSNDSQAIFDACENQNVEFTDISTTSACATLCEKYKCCFSQNSCSVPANVQCAQGAGCTVLWTDDTGGSTGGSMVLKIDVDDACITFDPAAAGAADQDCPKLCANAGCCFTTEGCSDNTNCHIYEECDIIYAVDDNDDDTGDNQTQSNDSQAIFDACENQNVEFTDISTTSACATLCEKYKCCFSQNSCSVPANVQCAQGAGCTVLWTDDTGGSSSGGSSSDGGSSGGGSSNQGTASEAIVEACSTDFSELTSLQPPGQPSVCEVLCEPYQCCFTVNNCNVPADTQCALGSPCEKIWA